MVWASGRTDSLGIIVDDKGRPLPAEFFDVDPGTGEQAYQPHHLTITRQNQVQIYQELVKSPEGRFTTSFLSLLEKVKDNRLLPIGWNPKGPKGFSPKFAKETKPAGKALEDKLFLDGSGSDVINYVVKIPRKLLDGGSVVATLYYQAIPPSYLKQRFRTAKKKNGQRLHYLASRLNLKGTNIENWKLLIASDTMKIDSNRK